MQWSQLKSIVVMFSPGLGQVTAIEGDLFSVLLLNNLAKRNKDEPCKKKVVTESRPAAAVTYQPLDAAGTQCAIIRNPRVIY